MKKLSNKANKIIVLLIFVVLSIMLVFTVLGLIKAIKEKNSAKAVNMGTLEEIAEYNEDFEVTEEIDIEELENYIEENENSSNKTKITDNSKRYYIKVNYGANVVTIYEKDENNNYTVPVKAMICSTGAGTPRSGTYGIKGRWEWGNLFGGVYGHYVTHIVGNILFHSVPYTKKYDPSSIEYWEYDKLGQSASKGCVRLTISDAKWIYNNVATGTLVEFYSSSDPGPLGKPYAQKISENLECRGWDPTDSSENNPWNQYKENNDNNIEENNNTNNSKNNTNVSENSNVINNVEQNNINQIENNVVDNSVNENNETTNTTNTTNTNNVINNICIQNNLITNNSKENNVNIQNTDTINN